MSVGYMARALARGETPEPVAPTGSECRTWRVAEGIPQRVAGMLAGVDLRTWQRWEAMDDEPVPDARVRDLLAYRWGSAP